MIDLFIGVPRVSSDEQAKGDSLAVQEREMRAYAERIGAKRVLIIPDDISGTVPIRARPGGRRLYAHIDQQPSNCAVCFADTSRIARDVDVFEVVQLMRDLRAAGIDFHILNRGRIDLNDPFSKVLIFMEGAAAGADNLQRAKKSTAGRRSKAQRGAIVGNGHPPYCHDRTGARRTLDYTVNTMRAGFIRQAIDFIIHHGYSTESAARWLQDAGAPVPSVLQGRKARGWYQSTLLRILRNPALIGVFKHGSIEVRRDDLRIIDDATWEALHAALQDNKHVATNTRREYLLSGRLHCSCGRRMGGRIGTRDNTYYHCTSTDNRRLVQPCGQRLIRANGAQGIDDRVWAAFRDWCNDEARIRAGVQASNAARAASVQPMRDELRQIDTDITRERTRLNRLDAALRTASEAAADVLQAQLIDAAERIASMERRRQQLARQIEQPAALDEAEIIRKVRKTRKGLEDADFVQRRRALEIFGVRCHVQGRESGRRRVSISMEILESVNLFIDQV